MPEISIVTPTLNAGRFIESCVESVRHALAGRDYEQVVVDGIDRLRDGAPVTVGGGERGAGTAGGGDGKPREHGRRREGEAAAGADGQPREGGKRRTSEGGRPAADAAERPVPAQQPAPKP